MVITVIISDYAHKFNLLTVTRVVSPMFDGKNTMTLSGEAFFTVQVPVIFYINNMPHICLMLCYCKILSHAYTVPICFKKNIKHISN